MVDVQALQNLVTTNFRVNQRVSPECIAGHAAYAKAWNKAVQALINRLKAGDPEESAFEEYNQAIAEAQAKIERKTEEPYSDWVKKGEKED